jgi:hypothetical protein
LYCLCLKFSPRYQRNNECQKTSFQNIVYYYYYYYYLRLLLLSQSLLSLLLRMQYKTRNPIIANGVNF